MNQNWLTDHFALRGKSAIVTGASKGIGANIAFALASAGANITVIGRSSESLEEVSDNCRRAGAEVHQVICNLEDLAEVRRTFEELSRKACDILVNNAGIIHRAPATKVDITDWERVISVNLQAVFYICQAIGRPMVAKGSGRIINIASLLSFQGGINVAPYTVSKHGVVGLTRALANEWGPLGVNVNAIAPGYIETDNTAPLREDRDRNDSITKRIPLGRWGTPEDIGAVAVFLSAPAANYINGEVIAVDGGWLSR
jgi:2-deoxy-D-gluconate 3-dehydrogenase